MNKLKSLLAAAILFLGGCASNNSYLSSRNITLEQKTYSVSQNIVREETPNGEIRFGFVSDIHNKKEKAEKIAQIFKEKNLDGIVIAGDMAETLLNEKKQIKDSLLPFLETGKPVYVIAGNHETKNDYLSAMNELGKKYSNLFDLATLNYVDLSGVNIFGVSGWDKPFPLGCFSVKKEIENVDKRVFSLDEDPVFMISHMPPKFQHKEAIDCIYWVKLENNKIVKSRHAGEKVLYEEGGEKINPRNSGKKELTDLIVEGNIDFSVSGHYHMNPGANNFEKNIPENEFSEKLFMSPGAAQYDMAGILTIEGDKAKYELLKIK